MRMVLIQIHLLVFASTSLLAHSLPLPDLSIYQSNISESKQGWLNLSDNLNLSWKQEIEAIFADYADRTPGKYLRISIDLTPFRSSFLPLTHCRSHLIRFIHRSERNQFDLAL